MKAIFKFFIIVLAFISTAEAQNRVLTDTTNMHIDTTWINYTSSSSRWLDPIYMDFDKNGSPDVAILNYNLAVGSHGCHAAGISARCYNDFNLSCYNNGALYTMFGYEETDSLCTIPINSSVWRNDSYNGIMAGEWCGPASGGPFTLGFWYNRVPAAYLGVQKMVGTTSVLGWIKITLNNTSETLVQYAFPRDQLLPLALGINNKTDDLNFNVFPNPNNGEISLSYHLEGNEKAIFFIYDTEGRPVSSYVLDPNSTSMQIKENELSNGFYFYKVYINGKLVKTEKIVIIK